MGKLPFSARIFWTTLVVVVVAVVVTWWLVLRFSDYEITPADYGGTTISTIILGYLVHLWLLPAEELHGEEEGGDADLDGAEDQEDSGEEA